MTPLDFRLICIALGFTAMAMHGDKIPHNERAQRAMDFATLIEEFCRAQLPECHVDRHGEG
jgi:hypothetical protein